MTHRQPCAGFRRLLPLMIALLFLAAPLPSRAEPVTCRIGVNIEDLYDLNMSNDTFGAILWVWTVCPTGEFSLIESLDFPTASGSLNYGAIQTADLGNGAHYASRRVQGTFRYNWNMRHYPFDRQTITIPIDESRYDATKVLFEPDLKESFLTPDIGNSLTEWTVSGLTLTTGISDETSTYGLPGATGARYARFEASFTLERTNLIAFLKLTAGVYAGVFIAFLTFFYDPNDRGGFGSKLGMLVGVLFAVLINLRSADTSIGDTGQLTLVTEIHLVTLVLIVALSLIALWDRRKIERGLPVRHPDWPALLILGTVYVLILTAMITRSALS